MRDSIMGCIGGLGWQILGAIFGRFPGKGGAICARSARELRQLLIFRSIAPNFLTESMFRDHFPGSSSYDFNSEAKRPVSLSECCKVPWHHGHHGAAKLPGCKGQIPRIVSVSHEKHQTRKT
jgi:hypothetical protein